MKNNLLALLSIALTTLLSCQDSKKMPQPDFYTSPPQQYENLRATDFNEFERDVVMNADSLKSNPQNYLPGKVATISLKELDEVKSLLIPAFNEAREKYIKYKGTDLPRTYNEYFKQYYACYEGGHKIVYVNFCLYASVTYGGEQVKDSATLHRMVRRELSHHQVCGEGGGTNYAKAEIDLTARRVLKFSFNALGS